jgi:chitodextrinase
MPKLRPRAPQLLAALLLLAPSACERPVSPVPAGASAPARADDVAPSAPDGLQAYAVSETAIRLTWNPASDDVGVSGYQVLRGESMVAATGSLDAADQGLSPATEYCYTVRALDAAGNRSSPAGPVCVPTPDRTPPTVPGAPLVEFPSPTQASITWAPSVDNVWVEGYELFRDGQAIGTGSEAAASDLAVHPPRQACYAVIAFDRAGNRSAPSVSTCALPPDLAAPSPPSRLVAAAGSGQVELSWAPSEDDVGVAGYEVLRGEEVVATVAAPPAVEAGLPAREHCYRVRALDAAGNRSPPGGPACARVPDTTPPSRPEDLVAAAPGETAVVLRWQPAADDVGVAGYEVLRGEEVRARSRGPAAGEDGLRAATEYCYRVRAFDSSGNRSKPSEPRCATTPDLTPPSAPPGPEAAPGADRAVDVRWKAATDNVAVESYEVLRGEEVVGHAESLQLQVTGLAPGREHCFAIRARDRAGNRSPPSAPACAVAPDLSPPTAPGEPRAAGVSSSQTALAWQPSTDDVAVAGYEVLRGDRVVATTAATAAAERGLQPSTEYCYRVRAKDAAGNRSGDSGEVCARTSEPGSPIAPSRLEARPAGERSVALRWDPSPDPSLVYVLFWEKGQRIGTTRFTSYRVDGLRLGERRCFQVAAMDTAGRTSPSTWPVCSAAARVAPVSAR